MTAAVRRHTIFTPALYCLEFVCNIIARYASLALDCFARPIRHWIASLTLAMTMPRTTRRPAMTTSRMPHSLARRLSRTLRGHLSSYRATLAFYCMAFTNNIIAHYSLLITHSLAMTLPGATRNRLSAAASPPPPSVKFAQKGIYGFPCKTGLFKRFIRLLE
jgi:hypothetical protein